MVVSKFPHCTDGSIFLIIFPCKIFLVQDYKKLGRHHFLWKETIIKCLEKQFWPIWEVRCSKFSGGACPQTSGPKKFFSPLRGNQNFLQTPLKPVKFWAASAPDLAFLLVNSSSICGQNRVPLCSMIRSASKWIWATRKFSIKCQENCWWPK